MKKPSKIVLVNTRTRISNFLPPIPKVVVFTIPIMMGSVMELFSLRDGFFLMETPNVGKYVLILKPKVDEIVSCGFMISWIAFLVSNKRGYCI